MLPALGDGVRLGTVEPAAPLEQCQDLSLAEGGIGGEKLSVDLAREGEISREVYGSVELRPVRMLDELSHVEHLGSPVDSHRHMLALRGIGSEAAHFP